MQRYSVPFKDSQNNFYEVRIYIDGYSGQVTQLRGARSTFVVTGSDEDFVYEPIRYSTASLTIISNELLLDLFSINSQYAPIELYKNGALKWTGYITPEQFTQPYKPTPDNISIDCTCALGTLENIKYEQQNESKFITAMDLLKYLIRSAKGNYRRVYIPHVYGSSVTNYADSKNILEEIELSEENFTYGEMMLDEVLTYLMRFFAWVIYDYEGSLYIVDPDWDGKYLTYNEELTAMYGVVTPNEVLLQNIGFAGSDHTIDIIPGYNKAIVKSINNVFDELLEEEDFKKLKVIGKDDFTEGRGRDTFETDKKEFLEHKLWKPYYYNKDRQEVTNADEIKRLIDNGEMFGAVLMRETIYNSTLIDGVIRPDINEYSWNDSMLLRTKRKDLSEVFGKVEEENLPAITIKGQTAAYMDGAFAINASVRAPKGEYMRFTQDYLTLDTTREFKFKLRIGNYYWNGRNKWVKEDSTFLVKFKGRSEGWMSIENTKNPDMPYNGLSGHIIPLPVDQLLIGDLELTMYCRNTMDTGFTDVFGWIMKDLKIDYQKRDDIDLEGENGDRVYENIVNEKNMSETDEIEFGIGSYNKDGATYSKALLNGKFLTDNLYSAIETAFVRPEESLIRRIIKRYTTPKVKLTQIIKSNDEIHPFIVIKDNSMKSKKFMMLNWVYDYEANNIQLSMIENG